jgi:dTDP-4-dehydrorhamnose 3,5-epimerase
VITTSPIPGVVWGTVVRHEDERGSFRELWRDAADDGRFVQANVSTSARGVLRGLHMHRHQVDRWIVARGQAFIALVDVRPMLGGVDRPIVECRTVVADTTVTIPTGVAHGFLAVQELELVYFVTALYDGSDELGFAWNDPLAAIHWPAAGRSGGSPILSARDGANPTLLDLLGLLKGGLASAPASADDVSRSGQRKGARSRRRPHPRST